MDRVVKLPPSEHFGVSMAPEGVVLRGLSRFTPSLRQRKGYNHPKWLYTRVYDPNNTLWELSDSRIQNLLMLMYGINIRESVYRDYLADTLIGAKTEVIINSGIVDIVTPDKVIEVKKAEHWKHAMGQSLAYSAELHKPPVVALIGTIPAIGRQILCKYGVDIIDLGGL